MKISRITILIVYAYAYPADEETFVDVLEGKLIVLNG